jgi:hypothetical protein
MCKFHSHIDNLVKKEKAEEILLPHLPTIRDCCFGGLSAFKEFEENCPRVRGPLRQRTIANIVNDWVVQTAKERFEEKPGMVEFSEYLGFFVIGFDKLLTLRFKKIDDENCTSNVRTHQQKEIDAQVLQFDDWITPTWIYAGYHLTHACDAIDRIAVSCRYEDYVLWSIEVFDGESGASGDTLPFPITPPPEPRKSKVKPKNLKDVEGD